MPLVISSLSHYDGSLTDILVPLAVEVLGSVNAAYNTIFNHYSIRLSIEIYSKSSVIYLNGEETRDWRPKRRNGGGSTVSSGVQQLQKARLFGVFNES